MRRLQRALSANVQPQEVVGNLFGGFFQTLANLREHLLRRSRLDPQQDATFSLLRSVNGAKRHPRRESLLARFLDFKPAVERTAFVREGPGAQAEGTNLLFI